MSAFDRIMYELIYRFSKPRWDNDQIPLQVAQLASEKRHIGKALDLGCGTGSHSIFLAQQGFTVTGIDISPTAIRLAREKALQAAVKAEFIVQDVTRLDLLHGPYDVALDVGCLHGLNAAGQQRYAAGLPRLLPSSGILLVWGMDPQGMGLGLTPERLEKLFRTAFKLERMEEVLLHRRPSKWYWLRRQ